ncbi:MAG: histidine kinase [Candidatus Cohnella colombiensis]|uniref:Histidine kinase n=1 Tax=Candidatus Cohnella colombiensis TaxID=3121368 RepID=A0AA95EUQ3_9BACL|nr:MAG: histidine kinase [Cohnella sp.]
MTLRPNTFTKIMGLIVMLLIPIIVIYWLSYRTSVAVVTDEVEKSMYKDLSFFASKTDEIATQVSKAGLLISEDINVRTLEFIEIASLYEQTNEQQRVAEKLRLLNASSTWDTTISVYAPNTQTYVSSNSSLVYEEDLLKANYSKNWHYTEAVPSYFRDRPRIIRYLIEPFETTLDKAGLIVELSFPVTDLVKALDKFKAGGKGNPFIITPDGHIINSSSADISKQTTIMEQIDPAELAEQQISQIKISESTYIISAVWMSSLKMYLIDYISIKDFVSPITANSYLFYGSIGFLLIGSIIAAYILYNSVQLPIRELIIGIRKLKRGEYPKLKVFNPNNEFHYLLVGFNDMALQIEDLIQNVYLETIRSRDANLKQLQSQINPHFLYNCFTLIRSLTRLGHKESVMELALHLSKYYRYTTRSERPLATLQEELDLVNSYLAIQAMNVQDLHYEIQIPEEMNKLEIPRLSIQPLAENAVIHGIGPLGEGTIWITALQLNGFNLLRVTDNGVGVSTERLAQLHQQIELPPADDHGCALWNTRQRMLLQFGQHAGLRVTRTDAGQLTVELYWPIESIEEGGR